MSNQRAVPGEGSDAEREHLDGLADGAGCAEIWAYLSERGDRADAS